MACLHAAIWSKDEQVFLRNPNSEEWSFQYTCDDNEDVTEGVSAFCIDSLMKMFNIKSIDLMKIDIEGAEKELFSDKSDLNWLSSVKSYVIELHDDLSPGCSHSFYKALLSRDLQLKQHVLGEKVVVEIYA